jgi:hypothetical protein
MRENDKALTKPPPPYWITLVRSLGFILGVLMIISASTTNAAVSDLDQQLSPEDLRTKILITILTSTPLLTPWKHILNKVLWWALFIALCGLIAAPAADLFSLLSQHPPELGPPSPPAAVVFFGFLYLSILGLQIPAIWSLRSYYSPHLTQIPAVDCQMNDKSVPLDQVARPIVSEGAEPV